VYVNINEAREYGAAGGVDQVGNVGFPSRTRCDLADISVLNDDTCVVSHTLRGDSVAKDK
jgi:hypothetical protein